MLRLSVYLQCDPTLYDPNDISAMCVNTLKVCEDGNFCNGVKVCEASTGSCIEQTPPVDCNDNKAVSAETRTTFKVV